MTSWRVIEGDALTRLRALDAGSVQTCVTSPPYFGLRDYGHDGQLGLEATPDEYVAALVGVFREVKRVLRDDGTLWLNLGDSYAGGNTASGAGEERSTLNGQRGHVDNVGMSQRRVVGRFPGVKQKDLMGMPWMVAFALRADGWYLRSDIIWSKPNPMPESVTDRPTKAHEYLFLLAKGPRYFYDATAIAEPLDGVPHAPGNLKLDASRNDHDQMDKVWGANGRRNKRSVWEVASAPFPGAHFAVFPPKLIEPCVLAGSAETACGVCGAPWRRVVERTPALKESPAPGSVKIEVTQGRSIRRGPGTTMSNSPSHRVAAGGETVGFEPSCDHQDGTGSSVVLDPFCGAGTTGVVATRHGRGFVGIELNPAYAEMARNRIRDDAPLMNYVTEAA